MTQEEAKATVPQDIVAIFHASFHPTQGNTVDWSLKASDDLSLDGLEFSALPSGLHLVEQDVVYFTKDGHHGVCVFRRRKTVEQGHRGFRLSSLGILLARSQRPRPWRHLAALKDLTTQIYAQFAEPDRLHPTESQWELAQTFFEERKVRRADLGGVGEWLGWDYELSEAETSSLHTNPTLHLSHLLRILGPSSLTLYKHVFGRRRILIYTLPPVEAACILCQVAADTVYDIQQQNNRTEEEERQSYSGGLKGRCKDPINVLGMITLSDMDRLTKEGLTGRGWIACTTDAIFLEKPSCYDLLIDLTTSTPNKATRPTFYISKPILPSKTGNSNGRSRGPTHQSSKISFAWSDLRLWNELDRILHLDSDHSSHRNCCGPSLVSDPSSPTSVRSKLATTWTDVWRVYEDVCVVCAGMWMGSWRGNSRASYSTAGGGAENWGKVRLEGDEDLSMGGSAFVRSLGNGIEGRPVGGGGGSNGGGTLGSGKHHQRQLSVGSVGLPSPSSPSSSVIPTTRGMRRASEMSWSSGRDTFVGTTSSTQGKGLRLATLGSADTQGGFDEMEEEAAAAERRDSEMRITLALLQTFRAHSAFQLSVLKSFLPKATSPVGSEAVVVYLAPKEILAFELGPFSAFDAKYLEWLVQEYAGDTKVVVKRGWKDLIGSFLGYA